MVHLNPVEKAILGLLDGPLCSLMDLEEALCPEVNREEVLGAIEVLKRQRLVEERSGRTPIERFFLETALGMRERVAQRHQQTELFRERQGAHV